MQQRDRATRKPSPRVSLHIGSSFEDAWSEIIGPWFKSLAVTASRKPEQNIVITPFQSTAYGIKRLLLDRGISFLGIRFMSPTAIRELLATKTNGQLVLPDHLRLLLSIVGEKCLALPEDPGLREERMLAPEFLAAKSVLRTPDHLLRTIERLGAAGWNPNVIEIPGLREIAEQFHRQLVNCGLELNHTVDARAAEYSETHPALFSNALVIGFNGAHWQLWPVLRAAANLAIQSTVILENPGEHAHGIDEAWVGTWENEFGPANPISPAPHFLPESLFTEEEMQGSGNRPPKHIFLVGADTTQEAEAIAKQCAHFLAEPTCERIGIVFPRRGSLARLTADALKRRGIPHYDGLAHLIPAFFEEPDWRAWLQLQENPRIGSVLKFMNALPPNHELFCGLEPETFARTLRDTYADVLIDDLHILKLACAQTNSPAAESVAQALDLIPFLPKHATFSEFLRPTKAALDQVGWQRYWMELSRYLGEWTDRVTVKFSHLLYLRWLREIATSFRFSRDPLGEHPYAHVQLLTVAQAAAGPFWTHIIFAGANEGSWPPLESGEFIREDEINAFNRTVRQLNQRVTEQGLQGEGHVAVRDRHTLYLGPNEQRQIASRQFDTLLESAKQTFAFTACLVQEEAPERFWNPSEILTRQYLEARHFPLTQQTMIGLQAETQRWLEQGEDRKKRTDSMPIPPEATRLAYDARRDPTVPSGAYDFAFHSDTPFVPALNVSEFDQMLSSPALVWLKRYVGVKAAEDNGNVWNTSTGKWVHDWLAAIAAGTTKAFTRLPDAAETERRICAAANIKRHYVEDLCRSVGSQLPDWWIGGWRNAVYLARALSEKLITVIDWPWLATEWTLDDDGPVEIISNVFLHFRGRIDLLLTRNKVAEGSLASDELWIVDYKTGAKRALSTARQGPDGRRAALKKKLLDGSALQLGLYALAAMRLGAVKVEVSLLSPLVRPLEPQMSGADFASEADIFAELARMQQTGVFGMHGPLRSAFRFTEDYPLATIAIDPDIIEQRWELTHPALVRDEEDMFW
jgi:hypothetical protein